jgi:hypothetical protein
LVQWLKLALSAHPMAGPREASQAGWGLSHLPCPLPPPRWPPPPELNPVSGQEARGIGGRQGLRWIAHPAICKSVKG